MPDNSEACARKTKRQTSMWLNDCFFGNRGGATVHFGWVNFWTAVNIQS